MSPVITLTTDFSSSDPYVGVMKGVIISRAPEARIVDLAHGLPRGQVLRAALVLLDSRPFFPAGTVHVAVVDPGVGTARKALAARAGGHCFIAPDNGLLWQILRDGGEEVHSIENQRVMLERVSRTFHGRDVFAPAAAHVARGGSLRDLGPAVSFEELARLEIPRPVRGGGGVHGTVLYADGFGNLVTNVTETDIAGLKGEVRMELAGKRARPVDTYAEGKEGQLLALWGSSGRLEFAVRDRSAAEEFGLRAGAEVRVTCG